MIIGINDSAEIKQIRQITDNTLTQIDLLDEVVKGWSDIRILNYCYKDDESGYSLYPAIDLVQIDVLELKSENETLRIRIQTAEQAAAETSSAQQELLELLVEMEVI